MGTVLRMLGIARMNYRWLSSVAGARHLRHIEGVVVTDATRATAFRIAARIDLNAPQHKSVEILLLAITIFVTFAIHLLAWEGLSGRVAHRS